MVTRGRRTPARPSWSRRSVTTAVTGWCSSSVARSAVVAFTRTERRRARARAARTPSARRAAVASERSMPRREALTRTPSVRPGNPRAPGLPQGRRSPGSGVTSSPAGRWTRLGGRARARARRRSVRVKATTALRSTDNLQQPVTAAVTERLDQLGLSGVLRPRVTVAGEKSR